MEQKRMKKEHGRKERTEHAPKRFLVRALVLSVIMLMLAFHATADTEIKIGFLLHRGTVSSQSFSTEKTANDNFEASEPFVLPQSSAAPVHGKGTTKKDNFEVLVPLNLSQSSSLSTSGYGKGTKANNTIEPVDPLVLLQRGRGSDQGLSTEKVADDNADNPDYLTLSDTHCTIGIHTSEIASFKSYAERPGLLGWFEIWFDGIQVDKLRACGQEHLAIPMITWEPLGVSMEGIAAGEFDAYLTTYFETVRAFCPNNDVLIRFAHEMETRPQYQFSWYEWQGLDPAVYIAAWKHVVDMGREICPNIKWVWSPNHADQYAEAYYPGDDYVDYVGVTLNLTVKEYYDTHYVDASDYYLRAGIRDWHIKYRKPQILSEFAYANDDLPARMAYFQSLLPLIRENPQLKAILFLDYDNTELRDFCFSDEPELTEIFQEIIREVHLDG